MNRQCSLLFVVLSLTMFVVPRAQAAFPVLTYRYEHYLFEINPNAQPQWQGTAEVWELHGQPIQPHASWRTEGDQPQPLPDGVTRHQAITWDRDAIANTLRDRIASKLDREAGSVVIRRSSTGSITFEGLGLPGRSVDIEQAVTLTIFAIEHGIADITLSVHETQPAITVTDAELRKNGISEVVTVGESNFVGSTVNRRHNIAVGLARFNGHLIPKDSTFSFNEILGPVGPSTGYRRELVILGERTLPDYGGGLCQVSTTAYRGVWEYGFPIDERRNHSFAVSYYGPQGTDATIYPPNTDMEFINDSPGDLLIQTHVDGDNAFFIFYGTRDDRQADIFGPYTWDFRAAPPERTEYTTDIPPGTQRKVGSAVPGLKAAWFRTVQTGTGVTTQGTYSIYEARPLFYQVGVEPGQMPASSVSAPIPSDSTSIEPVPEEPATSADRPSRRDLREGD